MKIYLLMMLIGTLLTAVHFTSAPETAVKIASAVDRPAPFSGARQRQHAVSC